MSRKHRMAVTAAVAALTVLGATACRGASPSASSSPKASGEPSVSLASAEVKGMKVGLVISSAGAGADVRDLASGAYVAAFRLNGATAGHDHVILVVADDQGTPDGATAAMHSLADQGVVGVVYGSTGEQVLAGVATAAELGLPVILPYADDPRVTQLGATSFLAAPTIAQAAAKLADHIKDAHFTKVASVHQAGSYGDAGASALASNGVTVAIDKAFTPGDALDAMAKAVVNAKPDAVVVWAEGQPAVAVADALSAAGSTAVMLFGDRAAVPAFGQGVARALAPSVGDGALSAGEWAGPDTPTAAVDAFYLARDRAVSVGNVSADLSLADFRSHDAVLALVAAAKSGTGGGSVTDALRAVKSAGVSGSTGVPLDFSSTSVVSDDNVSLLSYSTVDDGSGHYPPVANNGGHWLAVAGTYTPPVQLKGIDNPYGG